MIQEIFYPDLAFAEALCPVVQSIVSLTKWLVEDFLSLTELTKSAAAIFFAEKS